MKYKLRSLEQRLKSTKPNRWHIWIEPLVDDDRTLCNRGKVVDARLRCSSMVITVNQEELDLAVETRVLNRVRTEGAQNILCNVCAALYNPNISSTNTKAAMFISEEPRKPRTDEPYHTKLKRHFLSFRLHQEDRELLRQLGSDVSGDRHDALLDLVPIVKRLKLPDTHDIKRRPIRLGIPIALDNAIRELMVSSGQTYTDILIAAAQQYKDRK